MFGIDDALLIPLIGGLVSSVGGALIGNAGSKARVDQMNAYNTPAAQMARYSAAGLNPNLIYSQGAPGNQTGAAQFMSPDLDPVKIWSASVASKEAAMRNKLREAQVGEASARTSLHATKNAATSMLNQYLTAKYLSEEPYFAHNAQYQSEMLHERFKNEVKRGQSEIARQVLMSKDSQIRSSMLRERGYYETQRNKYGLQPNDNPFSYATRAGVSLLGDMGKVLHFRQK